jgi:voltage-gated potassium channel
VSGRVAMLEASATKVRVGLRERIAALFDDDAHQSRAAHYFNAALAAMIVLSVGAVILESVEPIRARHTTAFFVVEHVATAVFAVEYILRVWTAPDLHGGRYREPLWGRLRYAGSFFAIIDLVAVLPAFLGFIGAGDLRVLRLLRFLRMLKLTRHSTIFSLIWAVLREEARSIGALVFILCLTVMISGALMYMIEGDEQPGVFGSIPAAMWWAIETLTTVGYGDMVPQTALGRTLGGIVAIVGVATLALFSGLITIGFLDQRRLRREQASLATLKPGEPRPEMCPHCGAILQHERA